MKKNQVINAVCCDARQVTEESFSGYENISINAAILIAGERARALLNRHRVSLNVANGLDLPDEEKLEVQFINGRGELNAETDGIGKVLVVNGRLTLRNGSLEAAKRYYRILVNGKLLMPKSYEGCLTNLQVNGKTDYYPEGASILKADTEIDALFIRRAQKASYYCGGTLYLLDGTMDAEAVLSRGIQFAAKKIVITESLLEKLLPCIDEETELCRVPDGTRHIADIEELTGKLVRKYGPKLCVSGDVFIRDAEALAELSYLSVEGTVRVAKELEAAFDELDAAYRELSIVDTELAYIADRPVLGISADILKRYPKGLRVKDCAKIKLDANLSPETIMDKLKISDCAMVKCTKEQADAVRMIAEDVAMIVTADSEETEEGGLNAFLGSLRDSHVINAVEYKL